ncbi:MAG: fatty acyl-AMP ligase [Rhodovibrionaceae bacterium]
MATAGHQPLSAQAARPAPLPTERGGVALNPGNFDTLCAALDYAAKADTGLNFFNLKGELREALSYRDLRELAQLAALKLSQLGFERGDRLAILAETKPSFHVLFFACQYAGLIPVPLPLPIGLGGKETFQNQVRQMVSSSGARAVFGSDELIGFAKEALADLSLAFIGTPEELEGLPESGGDIAPLDARELSYIQYSSGSTSAPKGVAVTQKAATSNCRAIMTHGLKVREGDRCVSWLPLYHDMGLIGFFITPMVAQLTIDYLATSDFARRSLMWLRLISEHRGTIAFSPTFGYDLCAQRASSGAATDLDLSCWRIAGIGGDMVRGDVLNRFSAVFAPNGFRKSAFVPSYGLAEATLAVSFPPLGEVFKEDLVDKQALALEERALPAAPDAAPDSFRRFVGCGWAMPGHDLAVWDANDTPLEERRIGRVMIKGPSVMESYFGDPEATARVRGPDGWFDTGDLGYVVERDIVITGRSKDLIICNGRNIWPQDIEWAIEAIDGVRSGDAAAFSVDEGDGESVFVVIHCRTKDAAAREELSRKVAAAVKHSAGVDCTVVLSPPRGIPMTSSGKISRSGAKRRYLEGYYAPSGVE